VDTWVDNCAEDGRLLFPLSTDENEERISPNPEPAFSHRLEDDGMFAAGRSAPGCYRAAGLGVWSDHLGTRTKYRVTPAEEGPDNTGTPLRSVPQSGKWDFGKKNIRCG
jgi:hypothetical protein